MRRWDPLPGPRRHRRTSGYAEGPLRSPDQDRRRSPNVSMAIDRSITTPAGSARGLTAGAVSCGVGVRHLMAVARAPLRREPQERTTRASSVPRILASTSWSARTRAVRRPAHLRRPTRGLRVAGAVPAFARQVSTRATARSAAPSASLRPRTKPQQSRLRRGES
jgi:hypothetical protein